MIKKSLLGTLLRTTIFTFIGILMVFSHWEAIIIPNVIILFIKLIGSGIILLSMIMLIILTLNAIIYDKIEVVQPRLVSQVLICWFYGPAAAVLLLGGSAFKGWLIIASGIESLMWIICWIIPSLQTPSLEFADIDHPIGPIIDVEQWTEIE